MMRLAHYFALAAALLTGIEARGANPPGALDLPPSNVIPGPVDVAPAAPTRVDRSDRVSVKRLPLGAFVVEARFGYMEQPDVPAALRLCEPYGLSLLK